VSNPVPSMEMLERADGRRIRERLSTNENEFRPAAGVEHAIVAAAGEAHRYPDCDHFALRHRLADMHVTAPELIRIGTGADGLLGEICRTYLEHGLTAVTTEGTYPTFDYFARTSGASVCYAPYREDRVDTGELARLAVATQAHVVYVAEPDNPTGAVLGRRELLALADALPRHTLLVIDGAYADYQAADDRPTTADIITRRALWVRSFSKAHALAGLRVGYALGAPELIATLAERAEHYAVSRIAEAAALAALDEESHLAQMVAHTEEGRRHYTRELAELGLRALPGTTNFVTARCADAPAAEQLTEALLDRGIAIQHLDTPALNDCVRITVGPARQRATVLAAIRETLKGGAGDGS
jgi:histidinol-phosphate aminotransferase